MLCASCDLLPTIFQKQFCLAIKVEKQNVTIIFLWCCGSKRQANNLRIFSVPFLGKRERICLCPICVKPKLFIVQHPFNLPSFHPSIFSSLKGEGIFSPFHLFTLSPLKGEAIFSPFHLFTLSPFPSFRHLLKQISPSEEGQ